MKKIFLFSVFILSSILFSGGNIYAAAGGTAIGTSAITGVTIPVLGATPVTTLPGNIQYTDTISWSPNDSTFLANTVYTATINITPISPATLPASANFFIVEGATATNSANSGVVTAIFLTPINIPAIAEVTIPVVGATPVATLAGNDQYTTTISWSPNDSTFLANTVYTATITITPKINKTLTGVSADFFTVEGAIATNSINEGVITAIFPICLIPYRWTEQMNSNYHNWSSIISSSDGTKLAAVVYGGYIYTSTDSGATWVERTSTGQKNWQSIASSSDGTKLAAVVYGGYIYTSTDSGATWTERTSTGQGSWSSIASSSNGTKLAAVGNSGYIYTSIDSGATWIERTSAGLSSWSSIASSSDGIKLAAVIQSGYIYTSTDSGETWTPQTNAGLGAWSSITSSSEGIKLAAVNQGDYIYTSTDSGATWTPQTSSGKHSWSSITSSSDGIKLAATDIGIGSGGYTYISSDSGATWTPQISSGQQERWRSIASSSDGTKLAAAVSSGYIYTYNNIITTPILTTLPTSFDSGTVTLNGFSNTSSTTRGFQYGTTTSYGTNTTETETFTLGSFTSSISGLSENVVYHYRAYAINSDGTGYSPDATFIIKSLIQQTNSGQNNWTSITSSSDGKKLVATNKIDSGVTGYIYTSTDSGATWTEQTGAGLRIWSSVTSSSDGEKLAAVDGYSDHADNHGYIYTSTDSGATWTERTNSGQHSWRSITSSSDGTKLAAVDQGNGSGYIYTSTDSGATWTPQTNSGQHYWYSITSSSNGTKLAAVDANNGYIYTSTDSGATWTQQTGSGQHYWFSITSSSDGTKLVAVDTNNGYIYTSTDSGATWTPQISVGRNSWSSVASSSDGIKLAAVNNNGDIYISLDSGTTWIQQLGTNKLSWTAIVYSSDGKKLAVVGNSTYIYTYDENTYSTLTLSTSSPTSITKTTSTLNGLITDTGGEDPTIVGFNYGKTDSYGLNIEKEEGVYGLESFSSDITGLTCNTTYHYRAYATNSVDTGYGNDQTFITKACSNNSGGGSIIRIPLQSNTTSNIPVCLNGDLFNTFTGEACPTIVTSPLNITRVLKLNMKGDDIKALQVYLNTHGYIVSTTGAGSLGHETTLFGSLTKKAVIKFQKANKLIADGIVGKMTIGVMK